MEKAPGNFLKYTVRVGEPLSTHSSVRGEPPLQDGDEVVPRFCCRNGKGKEGALRMTCQPYL